MSWQIRRATVADADAVRSVAVAAWRDTYRELLADTTIEAFLRGPYGTEVLCHRIEADLFLVAEDARGLAAYADTVPEPGRVVLAALYALPQRRREGAGSALLEAIAALHPGLPIDADVLVGNRMGEAFYESRGFVPEETVQGALFGEAVTERRWRRHPRAASSGGPGPGR